LNNPIDIHGEPWSFWDSKLEIQSECSRNATQTDEDAPAIVHVVGVLKAVCYDGIFVYQNYY
jgi:hypothetical protein